MRVLRFMSAAEALKLFAGEELFNKTDHHAAGQSTTSVGFCFAMPGKNADDEVAIYEAAQRLSGITIMDICLVGELTPSARQRFRASSGRYSTGVEQERCTDHYGLDSFTRWRMYAPVGRSGILPVYSANWGEPEYILCEQDVS